MKKEKVEINNKVLFEAIRNSWSKMTAHEALKDEWSQENPSRGQCFVTGLIIQDYLGGDFIKQVLSNDERHYFNIIDGNVIDLTKDQFIPGLTEVRREIINDRSKHDVIGERYEILKNAVEDYIRKH